MDNRHQKNAVVSEYNSIKECYGYFNSNKPACHPCEHQTYCRNAADPALNHQQSFETIEFSEDAADKIANPAIYDAEEQERLFNDHNAPRYSRNQLLRLTHCLLTFDDRQTRDILRLKVTDPDISLATIGKRFGISKQAVRKTIITIIQLWPDFELILCNRPMYNSGKPVGDYYNDGAPIRVLLFLLE